MANQENPYPDKIPHVRSLLGENPHPTLLKVIATKQLQIAAIYFLYNQNLTQGRYQNAEKNKKTKTHENKKGINRLSDCRQS